MALCDGCQKFMDRFFNPKPSEEDEEKITIHNNFAELSECANTFCDLCRFIRRELCCHERPYDLSLEDLQDNDNEIKAKLMSDWERKFWLFYIGERPRRYIYPHNSSGRNNSPALQIRGGDPSLDQLLTMSRQWLAICCTEHKNCYAQVRNERTFRPTRLLDVQQQGQQSIQLVLSEHLPQTQSNDYLTLSYCWGEAQDAACTTKENLSERLQAISIASLPKTIRDAVEITRAFGVRYLWVDALCIIQAKAGENEDWQREFPKMGKIYKHSLFTIAASGAKDSSVGCFHRREAARWPVEDYHFFDEHRPCGPYNPVVMKPTLPKWEIAVESSALAKRGWVLQERMLASRTLFWTEEGLFWQCNEMTVSEYQVELPNKYFIEYPTLNYVVKSFGGKEDESLGCAQAWLNVLHIFSEKALTVPTDKVPAIVGLGYEVSRLTGRGFEMGVFEHNLVRELAWSVRPGEVAPQAARLPGMPSWSWASTNSKLRFSPQPVDRTCEELVTNASLNAHQLRIRGRLGSVRVKKATEPLHYWCSAQYIFVPIKAGSDEDTDGIWFESAALDTLADTLPEEGGTIRCIEWLRWFEDYHGKIITGALIVSPVDEEKNIYRRIGWLDVLDTDFFEEEFRDITLV